MKIALIISENNNALLDIKKEVFSLSFITSCDTYINNLDPEVLTTRHYDVLFYDMDLFKLNGTLLYRLVKKNKLKSRIILLSGHEVTFNLLDLNTYNISGNIRIEDNTQNTISVIVELLKQILLNNIQNKPVTNSSNLILLTEREKQILKLFVNGFSYKEVGNHLDVKLDTVRSHIRNMYRKLNVRSKTEAVMKIIEIGIVD